MRLTTFLPSLLLLGLAAADSTTTITSTATLTKTITVSQVVQSVTSTYASGNSTIAGPTAVNTGSSSKLTASSASATKTLPANYMGAGNSLSGNGIYAGSAGVLVMIAAALL